MRKVIWGSSATLLAAVTGVAALSFSPAGCSCTDVWTDYVVLAGLTGGNGVRDITEDRLQVGLWNNLKDKRLEFGQFALGEKYGCVLSQPLVVTCHSVLETSPLLNRGFDVHYNLTPGGNLKSVRVQRFTELHPNNSFKPKPLRGSA